MQAFYKFCVSFSAKSNLFKLNVAVRQALNSILRRVSVGRPQNVSIYFRGMMVLGIYPYMGFTGIIDV